MPNRARGRGSDRFSQSVLDALPTQIAVLDGQGCILAVNRAWRRFAAANGGSVALASGTGLDYVAACRSAVGDEAEQARAVAEGITAVIHRQVETFSHEYPCHAPDQERWFALSVTPLGESREGAVVVHFDISARKRAELQARRATECAAQAARVSAVGVLAASLVHELTQPLSAASFYSGTALALLSRGHMTADRLGSALEGVDAQIQRASEIVQRLRGFLRRREMRLELVPIHEVVAGAAGLVQWFAADRKVRLRLPRSRRGPMVLADALQLEQVLVNLICNGIQAIDAAGGVHREVAIEVQEQPGEVELRVRDTGPGVPAGDQDRLFDIFASTKDGGLGMGLSISREIVEAHGGRLWCAPDGTEGACFHFTVPRPPEGGAGSA